VPSSSPKSSDLKLLDSYLIQQIFYREIYEQFLGVFYAGRVIFQGEHFLLRGKFPGGIFRSEFTWQRGRGFLA
jgi:hypothetical protein